MANWCSNVVWFESNEAIGITAQYKGYRHEDKRYSDFDKKLRAYWTDMYEKLTAIKERLNNN